MNPISLLDGSELDRDTLLSTDPAVLAVDAPALVEGSFATDVYDEGFGGGGAPDWLTYGSMGGPAPTYNGFASSTVTLTTDNAQDANSAFSLPQIDYSEWSGVHLYADFTTTAGECYVALADKTNPTRLDGTAGDSGFEVRARAGDTYHAIHSPDIPSQRNHAAGIVPTTGRAATRIGLSITRQSDGGYMCRTFADGRYVNVFRDAGGGPGFPERRGMTPAAGVLSDDGAAVSADLDRVLVVLER